MDELINSGGSLAALPPTVAGEGYMSPEQFRAALEARDEDTVVIDVRKAREAAIGKFDGAIVPPVRSYDFLVFFFLFSSSCFLLLLLLLLLLLSVHILNVAFGWI